MMPVITFIMQEEVQEVVCPVCMNTFRRPATLPCGHTFCFSCLLNATQQQRNCPICRQHFPSTPQKMKTDLTIAHYIEELKQVQQKQQKQDEKEAIHQNIHIECKEERLLLIDITTDDLLLPFNRVTATFELQSNGLIDRLERFVGRQERPFNKYSVVCRLIHIEQLRKNLFKGVIQGISFAKIESESIESQLSLELDQQEFFYRACSCKEITQASDSSTAEYDPFFSHFNRIKNDELKMLLYQRIDSTIFSNRNDPIAVFYGILGVIDIGNEDKYELAISFDEERRVQQINKFISSRSKKLERNPSCLVTASHESGGDRWAWALAGGLAALFWLSREQFWAEL